MYSFIAGLLTGRAESAQSSDNNVHTQIRVLVCAHTLCVTIIHDYQNYSTNLKVSSIHCDTIVYWMARLRCSKFQMLLHESIWVKYVTQYLPLHHHVHATVSRYSMTPHNISSYKPPSRLLAPLANIAFFGGGGAWQPPVGQGLLIHEVSSSHTTTHHSRQDSSRRVISPTQRSLPVNTQQSQLTDRHPCPRDSNTISAGERPQTYALERAATGIGFDKHYSCN
jgi:hypothetical protein